MIALKLFFIKLLQNPNFIIEISEGTSRLKSGKVSNKFIQDCQDVVDYENIKQGFIWSVEGSYGKQIIKASSEVSSHSLQKIRNLWTFYS
jgi:hypothetical protein